MVKTRLSKVLAMLLALTMVLSTMVIDFTAFADNANVPFTVTAEVDDTDYNKGETVTVKYYAKADVATNISSYQFTVTKGAGLTLASLASDLTGGTSQVNLGNGKIAWARNDSAAVKIGTEGTLIATATFTAVHDATAQNVAISAEAIEITPQGYDGNVAPSVVPTAVNLWNITVAFSGDTGIKNDVTGTAYVKYGEPGLYASTAYDPAAKYTPVAAEAKDTYRLEDENAYWKVSGVEGYKTAAQIAEMTFTANATAVATTVKQYTITFEAGEGAFAAGAPEAIIIDTGKTLSTVELPGAAAFTAPAGKNFAGFKIKDTETVVNDGTVVESDLVLVAIYSGGEYAWSTTPNQSAINVTAGVTENKVKHGVDVEFTVTANPGYVVSGVSYSVAGGVTGQSIALVAGKYTIDGDTIVGAVTVEVTTKQYFTVTFAAADGATYTTDKLTAYVEAGTSKLYASPEELAAGGASTFVLPAYTIDEEQYRADTSDPVLKWTIGSVNYSDTGIGDYVFNEATTIKPYVIKYWVITFKLGANGKWADGSTADVVLNIDAGAAITGYKQPIADTGAGYVFSAWSEEIAATATEAKTYTANFIAGEYAVTFPENVAGVEINAVSGLTGGKATFGGDDVTFKLSVNETIATLDSVQYKVNGNDPVTIEADEETGVYKIPSSEIVADTTVLINTTGMIAVTFAAENGTVTTNTIYVENGAKLTAGQLAQVDAKPNTHYEADKIYIIENETETEITEEALLAKEVTAAFTVKYTYKLKVYGFVAGDYTVDFEDGFDVVSNTKDLKFKVTKADTIVLDVKYQVGGAAAVAATFDQATGIYTIAGANVTGDITLVVEAVAGTVGFIARNEYKAIVDENLNEKILVVTTNKVDGKAYQYKGANMFYSSVYRAYVAWVADAETAELAPGYLTVVDTPAVEISYDYDINETSSVTAADAGIINDSLHGQRATATSDLMLFELDVDGNKFVSTADMTPVLMTAVGNPLEQ